MNLPLDSSDFHPETLSDRERRVIDLAAKGSTDRQIAAGMGISRSTVNSYWVRIRGKVGQHNRTEIVGRMLRLSFDTAHDDLLGRVESLEQELAASASSLARSKSERTAERGGSWHLLALRFVPEAVLVARFPGEVVYANLRAERLFHAEPGALDGCAVCELTVPEGQEDRRRRIRDFMEAEETGSMALGVEEPCFALGRDEANFRALISVEGFDAPEGFMGVFTVREFLGDVDAVLRSLRKPLIVA